MYCFLISVLAKVVSLIATSFGTQKYAMLPWDVVESSCELECLE